MNNSGYRIAPCYLDTRLKHTNLPNNGYIIDLKYRKPIGTKSTVKLAA